MKFRVNKGQSIPQVNGVPGGAERVIHTEGAILEGPAWWVEEFASRMTPLDEHGNPVEGQELQALGMDLATARAHEKVTILEDMIRKNPSMAEMLSPELDRAKSAAEEAEADLKARRSKGKDAKASAKDSKDAKAHSHAGGPTIRRVSEQPQEKKRAGKSAATDSDEPAEGGSAGKVGTDPS